MDLIRDNMDSITQERPNEESILNVNKQVIWQSLSKAFATHVEKSIIFATIGEGRFAALFLIIAVTFKV